MDWVAFLSAFGLVIVAELGDKTQLAVVTQTCKHHKLWAVFAGATAALIAITALGVVGGQLVGQLVPEGTLRIVAALAFGAMGVLVAREAIRAGNGLATGEICGNPQDEDFDGTAIGAWDWRAFGSTLGLVFLAELGDRTQSTVVNLSSKQAEPWAVFAGGASALILVTALGVAGGQRLCRLLPERVLLWASAATFVAMGTLLAVGLF
jgi:putative Ca2+/H+ antiporter (TMEM165/GDT1 family)